MKVAAAVVAALVLSPGPALAQSARPGSAQAPEPPHVAEPQASKSTVFRSSSALVSLNVTVQDTSAKYVGDLTPADFAVYEDGVKQDVQFFESTAVPVDLIVLIDTSSSMADKIGIVRDAASGFLKTLRAGDRGAVVGFADTVSILQPLTSDHTLLEQAVRGTIPRGSTAMNNALYVSLKQFGVRARQEGSPRRQAIVVLSDGEDTASLVSFDEVLGLAKRMGVNIYTVALQSKRTQIGRRYFSDADYAMKALARETGAQFFFPTAPAELKSVYGTIATELANQYSIGYVPANLRPDGRFRRVVVQILNRTGLRPRTRAGYTADGIVTTSAGNLPPR